mmetsp:Transcript_45130/g.81500  ORF Transcript_45130/g.81500 Transcript_45130/m.81500 type:complete len:800 (-) Transcript_45130:153-2552(-)
MATAVFRSGWATPPRVTAPRGTSTSVSGNASGRSGSAPGTIRNEGVGAAAMQCGVRSSSAATRSSSSGAVQRTLPRVDRSFPDLLQTHWRGADSDTESVVSGRSTTSKQSTNATLLGFSTDTGTGTHGVYHEGWLSKRTSGRVARWQRRYFTLEGCVLRYYHKPGAPVKRTFDIRRAKRISIAAGQARELELDFTSRVWRLRAETPESARRWQLLLDTGRLVVGADVDVGECDDDWSDNDSSSSCSSVRSANSVSSLEPLSQAYVRATGGEQPKKQLAIIEVDTEALERKFEGWFPYSTAGSKESGQSAEQSQHKPICEGLQDAFNDLWTAFGADRSKSAAKANQSGPQAALRALRGRLEQDPEGLECVLGEYLSRIQQNLKRWVEHCDPLADEVKDTVQWLLFEMHPSLELFEAGLSSLVVKKVSGWRTLAAGLQAFMLGEWETRSCDEAFRRCSAVYGTAAGGTTPDGTSGDHPRSKAVMDILYAASHQWSAWKKHDAASEHAASVLIASLNTVLRSYRASVCILLPVQTPAVTDGRQGAKERVSQLLREVRRRALKKHFGESRPTTGAAAVPLRGAVAAAAAEAAAISEFCQEVVQTSGPDVRPAVWIDVLAAFACAFRRECAALCSALIEVHFTSECAKELKGISFATKANRDTDASQGVLREVCGAAKRFMSDALSSSPQLCRALASDALVQLVVRQWARKFQRGLPRCSSWPQLPKALAADQAALQAFAEDWGANSLWREGALSAVNVLHDISSLLKNPSPELMAAAAVRMEPLLGMEAAQSLTKAARHAASR